jgi:hypothetical protein
MIVVVGLPAYRETGGEGWVGGVAAGVAIAAREAGCAVELAGKVGDDAAGDAVVLVLGQLGIGHAALLRDATRPTPLLVEVEAAAGDDEASAAAVADEVAGGEPPGGAAGVTSGPGLLPADPAERPALEAADVALGLQYLSGISVVVLAEPLPAEAVAAAVEGVAFCGAQLVVVSASGATLPTLPAGATALEAPSDDDGSFARLVGVFAVGLDGGLPAAEAFTAAVGSTGWEEISGDDQP